MSDNALVVFTNKSRERIPLKAGASDWVVGPGTVKKLEYVVCARNSQKVFEQGRNGRSALKLTALLSRRSRQQCRFHLSRQRR